MKINNEVKLDFDDVLLVPHRSRAASRADVNVERLFKFYHSTQLWNGLPIFAANMDSTGTIAMAKYFEKINAITCLHKHYSKRQYIQALSDIKSGNCWYTMGMKDKLFSDLHIISEAIGFIPNICIDVANGYTDGFVEFCSGVRSNFGNRPIIMAGNVCTPEMVQELILHGGVDIVKIGIGPGSACTTRLKTGVGYPQLSSIIECSHAAHGLTNGQEGLGVGQKGLGLICADGGCRTPADVVKAFAANADFVMLGGMLAGTEECEGEWEYSPRYSTFEESKKLALNFYGMSSHKAQEKYGTRQDYRASEGRVMKVLYKGLASEVMTDIVGGIRGACTLVGADCLKDLPKCAEFIRVNRVHFDKSV